MRMPWFIELLGVEADADERAVKRAYARLLKQADPAADPAGFARLREAYELARSWATQERTAEPVQEAIREPLQDPVAENPPPLPLPAPAARPVATNETPDIVAKRLVDRFARRVKYGDEAGIPADLEACANELRRHHIDTPFLFERMLLDALQRGTLRRRPAVFAAAHPHFGWREYMHLASLGPAGAWVDAIEHERLAFDALDFARREDIRHWLVKHGDGDEAIPDPAAFAWPRLEGALAQFPRYLGLYLSDGRKAQWKARYEALASSHQAEEAEAERMKHFKAARIKNARDPGWFMPHGMAVIVMVLISLVTGLFTDKTPSKPPDRASHAAHHIPGRTEAERSKAFVCMMVVDQMHAPNTHATREQAAQTTECDFFLDRLRRDEEQHSSP